VLKEMMGLHNNTTVPDQILELINRNKGNILSSKTSRRPLVKSRRGRPARLLPYGFLFERKNDTNKAFLRFYGPPTNCSELSQLGYTLNGFYLVKSPQNNDSSTKDGKIQVEAFFCKFKHSNGSKVIETMPVNLKYDIKPYAEESLVRKLPDQESSSTTKSTRNQNKFFNKSSDVSTAVGVHFRVRSKSYSETKSTINIIKFDDTILNIGGGLYDESKGVFTIPKTGIYQVAFSGLMSSNTASLSHQTIVELRVNNGFNEFTRIVNDQLLNQVLLATIKLQQGDTLSIRINIDKENSIKTKSLQLHSQATLSATLLDEETNVESSSLKSNDEESSARKLPDHQESSTRKSFDQKSYGKKWSDVSTSAGVHFRVRSTSYLETEITINVIKFDNIILNIGGGKYSKSKGVYTVPKTGIYQIAFSGLIYCNTASLSIPTIVECLVNDGFGAEFIRIVDNQLLNRVLLVTIKLQQGDKLCVRIIFDRDYSFKSQFLQLHSEATLSATLLEAIDVETSIKTIS